MNVNERPSVTIDMATVFQRWQTLALACGAVVGVAALFLLLMTPEQEVVSKLLVEPRVGVLGIERQTGSEKAFLPTQAEILSSPTVIRAAVSHLSPQADEMAVGEQTLKIAAKLNVDPLSGTNILQLRYLHADGEHAVDVVKALIAGYREYLRTASQSEHEEMLTLLTEREQELRGKTNRLHDEYNVLLTQSAGHQATDAVAAGRILAALEELLSTVRQQRLRLEQAKRAVNGTARSSDAETVHIDQSLRTSATTKFTPQDSQQRALDELARLSGEGWSSIHDPASLELQLQSLQLREAELQIRYGPRHAALQAVRSSIRLLSQQRDDLAVSAPGVIDRELESVLSQEQALAERYEFLVEQTTLADSLEHTHTRKLNEIARAQVSLSSVQEQLRNWQLAKRAADNGHAEISVAVLEAPATVPRSFVANPLIVLGTAGLLGLMLGVLIVIGGLPFRNPMLDSMAANSATENLPVAAQVVL